MRIEVDVPDDMDPVRLEEARLLLSSGEYLVFLRPSAMTNEEAFAMSSAVVETLVMRYGRYRQVQEMAS